MELNIDEISKLVTISKPIIDPIIGAIIKPKIDQLSKWISKKEKDNIVIDNFFENKFSQYLSITLDKCRNVNVLIFQNQQIDIKDIYYPLTIESNKDHKAFLINDVERSLFESYKKI